MNSPRFREDDGCTWTNTQTTDITMPPIDFSADIGISDNHSDRNNTNEEICRTVYTASSCIIALNHVLSHSALESKLCSFQLLQH